MRKAIVGYCAAMLLVLASGNAVAEWVQVAFSDTGVYYIDPATIRKNGNLRRAWEIQDLKNRGRDGELSLRLLQEYDCKNDRSRILSLSLHAERMANGKVLASHPGDGQWDHIPPETIAEATFRFVCRQ